MEDPTCLSVESWTTALRHTRILTIHKLKSLLTFTISNGSIYQGGMQRDQYIGDTAQIDPISIDRS